MDEANDKPSVPTQGTQREIKFRAYQPHNSLHRKPGIYQVSDIIWYDKTPDGYTGEVFFNDGSNSSEYLEDVQLMQYTGLKDKNGVEIFEGDIVKELGYVKEAEWSNEGYGWVFQKLYATEMSEGLEIIGNIMENPELL